MKINKQQIFICLMILLIGVIFILLIPKFSLFSLIAKITKSSVVKTKILTYFDSIYNSETSSFIKLFLFNVKSDQVIEFYKQTVDLSIVWLISCGGFHISFLSRLILRIFKKNFKVGKWVDFSILLIYSFLLQFSYSSIRVILILMLNPLFKKYEIKSYNKIGLIGLCIFMLNPCCFGTYSFMLSFTGVTGAYFIQSLDIENKLISKILISIVGFATTIPFVVNMNHKISLFTFINSFIFSNVFAVLFIYFLIFSWMPFMGIIHYGIIVACYCIIGNISYLNIYIWAKTWQPYIIFGYYTGIYGLFKLVYLIVWNNKI